MARRMLMDEEHQQRARVVNALLNSADQELRDASSAISIRVVAWQQMRAAIATKEAIKISRRHIVATTVQRAEDSPNPVLPTPPANRRTKKAILTPTMQPPSQPRPGSPLVFSPSHRVEERPGSPAPPPLCFDSFATTGEEDLLPACMHPSPSQVQMPRRSSQSSMTPQRSQNRTRSPLHLAEDEPSVRSHTRTPLQDPTPNDDITQSRQHQTTPPHGSNTSMHSASYPTSPTSNQREVAADSEAEEGCENEVYDDLEEGCNNPEPRQTHRATTPPAPLAHHPTSPPNGQWEDGFCALNVAADILRACDTPTRPGAQWDTREVAYLSGMRKHHRGG
jgi:hypothetical protein